MRTRNALGLVLLVTALMGTLAVEAQQDPASNTWPAVTAGPKLDTNQAITGSSVDRANYAGAFMLVLAGHVRDATTARRYAVLQDSSAGLAYTAYDSVLVDTTDNVTYKVAYRGAKRFLQVILRAGTGAADTAFLGVAIVRTGARSRNGP